MPFQIIALPISARLLGVEFQHGFAEAKDVRHAQCLADAAPLAREHWTVESTLHRPRETPSPRLAMTDITVSFPDRLAEEISRRAEALGTTAG